MGIKGLNKAIKDTAPDAVLLGSIDDIPKGVYGVDVSIYLYPGLYNQESKGKGSHIRKFFDMIIDWRKAGHNLVMVFDGDTHSIEAKKDTIEERKEITAAKYKDILQICQEITSEEVVHSGKVIEVTDEMHEQLKIDSDVETIDINDYAKHLMNKVSCTDEQYMMLENAVKKNISIKSSDIQDLVDLFEFTGTPYLRAEGEADHMLADMYEGNLIDGVISEDGDMLTHGVCYLIRGINDHKCRRDGVIKIYNLQTLLASWNITYRQFVDVCILSGCDYNKNKKIAGIACKTARKLICKHGSVENYLSTLKGDKLDTVPENFLPIYHEAVRIFCSINEQIPESDSVKHWRNVPGMDQDVSSALSTWLQKETNYTSTTVQKKVKILNMPLKITRTEPNPTPDSSYSYSYSYNPKPNPKPKPKIKVTVRPKKPQKIVVKVKVNVNIKQRIKPTVSLK